MDRKKWTQVLIGTLLLVALLLGAWAVANSRGGGQNYSEAGKYLRDRGTQRRLANPGY